ncbi:MAG: chorismate synthase [Methanobacteriota archaeon]
MNTIGRIFRVSVLGESHGECVGALLHGCPAGMKLAERDFTKDIARRKPGAKGTTSRRESDAPKIMSGVLQGRTTGAPLLILFENEDADGSAYDNMKNLPRPGHADFVAMAKYGGYNDHRGGGHFSGRLTLPLVAAGVVAKKIARPAMIEARLVEAGGKVRGEKALKCAMEAGDSIGGLVECRAKGLPVGLGEPFFDTVESVLSHALFAIPAVKGVEFGAGFGAARMLGSECSDEYASADGKTLTNHAGGIHGGITNGNELVLRIAVKPTSTIKKPRHTLDTRTGKPTIAAYSGRHDACIALRVPVVVEAVTAIVLADLMLINQERPRVARS